MYQILFTIDYEIHGNGEGSPYSMMVEPTYRMMKLFDKYNAKLTIMADVAEILKFKEYKQIHGEDKYDYDLILEQLKFAVSNGHDVQLHIHSGYFNSEFKDTRIKQNWSEYDLANMSYDKIFQRVKICKLFLENELRKSNSDYRCIAFRAANWSMIPTKNIARALINNDIYIDSSVFKWGVRNGRVKFDYTDAHDKLTPWFIDERNVCFEDNKNQLLEVPIYTELRNFWAFITVIRAYRMIRAKFHKHDKFVDLKSNSNINNRKIKSKIIKLLSPFVRKHAWKLDLNQASGWQLKKALKRISKEYSGFKKDIPIVLIGHSKSFIKYNEVSLKPFLRMVKKQSSEYSFSTFKDIKRDSWR